MDNQNNQKIDPSQFIGKRIANYEVLELVGKGGMGFVFRARDISLDREVALKILRPDLLQDKEFESRFVREARNSAKLEHPGIVQVYSAGKVGDILFIAMQYVRGDTITKIMENDKTFEWKEALHITRNVLEALHSAHRGGFVHRDIKPTNIMVDENGATKIMDFGLMKHVTIADGLTKAGVYYGTPEYSSPEQCQAETDLDARTDIYSLGAVIYEMLTGRLPHIAETAISLFKKIEGEDPIPVRVLNPDVPKQVEDLVNRMMSRDINKRFQSANQVIAAIDRILHQTDKQKLPIIKMAAGAIAAVLVVLFSYFVLFSSKQERRSEPEHPIIPTPKKEIVLLITDLMDQINQDNPDPDAEYIADSFRWKFFELLRNNPVSMRIPPSQEIENTLKGLAKYKDVQIDRLKQEHIDAIVEFYKPDAWIGGKYWNRNGIVTVELTLLIRDPQTNMLVGGLPQKETYPFQERANKPEYIAGRYGGLFWDEISRRNEFKHIFSSVIIEPTSTVSFIREKLDLKDKQVSNANSDLVRKFQVGADNSSQFVHSQSESYKSIDEIVSLYSSARIKLPRIVDESELYECDQLLAIVAKLNPEQLIPLDKRLAELHKSRARVKLSGNFECPREKTTDVDHLNYCNRCGGKAVYTIKIEKVNKRIESNSTPQ